MKKAGIYLAIMVVFLGGIAGTGSPKSHLPKSRKADAQDPWATLPFTAREWARQAQLPYRRIPLKNGGTMSVQEAYDLFLKAGQPPYPDMDTPGLVTEKELQQQIKLSKKFNSRA